MKIKLVFHCLFWFICLAVWITACAAQPQQQPEIRIGVLATLSGDETIVERSGKMTVNAAQLAAEQINQAGGLQVGGKRYRIVLMIEDDTGQPEGATAAAQKLINQANVFALIGPQFSKNAIPVAELAERSGIPMISPMSTNPRTTQGKSFVFRVGFIDSFQGDVMARFAFNELGARKAAVLYDVANEYNRTVTEIFVTAFQSLGGEALTYEYTTGETEFIELLQQILTASPDVLLLPNYYNEVVLQMQQATEIGLQTTILGSDTWGGLKPEDYPLLDGAFYSSHWHIENPNQQSLEFVEAFRAAYGVDPIPTAAMTYDAFGLLFAALQDAGSLDAVAVRDALAATQNYYGVTGQIGFRGTGDPVKSAVILQIKDGALKVYKLYNP